MLSDGARSYAWDGENRLIGVSGTIGGGAYSSSFGYDGLGRRVVINDSGSVTHFGWCGQTLCQKRDGLDHVLRRYLAEGEADLTDNALLYKGVDHLGSVRDVIALPGGPVTNHFDYDPYGNPTTSLGSALTATDFRYAGLFYHQPSGLYLATHRAYNPAIGRWPSLPVSSTMIRHFIPISPPTGNGSTLIPGFWTVSCREYVSSVPAGIADALFNP